MRSHENRAAAGQEHLPVGLALTGKEDAICRKLWASECCRKPIQLVWSHTSRVRRGWIAEQRPVFASQLLRLVDAPHVTVHGSASGRRSVPLGQIRTLEVCDEKDYSKVEVHVRIQVDRRSLVGRK